jgi:ABC-type transport system involved in multi-copper enzyme maturation permease subunit
MSKVLAIVRQDVRVFLTNRSNLPGLLITPAVMTVIIALVTGGAFGGPAIRRLDILDQDGSPASAQFLESVRQANPGLTLCPMDNSPKDECGLGKAMAVTEGQALDRVANSTSLDVLEIPSGFGAAIASQKPIAVTFRSSSSFGTSQSAQQAVEAALSQVNSAALAARVGLSVIGQLQGKPLSGDEATTMESALYGRALEKGKASPVSVEFMLSGTAEGRTVGQSLQQGLGQSVPGMGTMFVLMTIFGGMAALIVERQQGTLQRLAVMPVSRSTLLIGKILARFSLGLLQFLVVFVVGAVLGMNFGRDPVALLLLVIVYTLSVTAVSFAIGSGLKNASQASGLALLLTLTLAPLGGAWWPMSISPRIMQIAGHISPVAWAMDGFTRLTYEGGRLADLWLPLSILAGMTVVAFLIAIPRFRYSVE